MEMTRAVLQDICKQSKLYRTPHLNDKLYLHFKGFTRIACLEEYTGLKALFLEGNALSSLQGLPPLPELKCLYVQQNCLRSLEGLEQLPHLNTLNVSSNGLSSLVELPCCPQLATLLADRNHLSTLEALEPLLHCPSLHTLDLQNNSIEDPAVIDAVIARLPQLHCLYLAGNPVVSKVPSYRKSLIARCRELTYLDDRPITDEERQLCAAWADGGIEAERTERTRQKEAAAARERRNLEWLQQLRREGFRKRRAMLGLPDGDEDPVFDTLPDQQCRTSRSGHSGGGGDRAKSADDGASSTDAEDLSSDASEDDEVARLQEPPALMEARQRLAAYYEAADGAGAPAQPPAGACAGSGQHAAACTQEAAEEEEDGIAYLSSVRHSQQELDAAGGAPLPVAAAGPCIPATSSVDAGTASRLASLRAANQAALAAIGLSEVPTAAACAATDGSSSLTISQCVVVAEPDDDDGSEASAPALQHEVPVVEPTRSPPDCTAGLGSHCLRDMNSWLSAATERGSGCSGSSGSSSRGSPVGNSVSEQLLSSKPGSVDSGPALCAVAAEDVEVVLPGAAAGADTQRPGQAGSAQVTALYDLD